MNMDKKRKRTRYSGGFTLIEMLVSVAIFSVAMVIVVGSLVSLNDAARKARTIRIATDNLSAAVDSMSRTIRMGIDYHCELTNGAAPTGPLRAPQNCPMTDRDGGGGGDLIAVEGQQGSRSTAADQIVYRLLDNRIKRSTDGGATYLDLTAPEINIDHLRFYVHGTQNNEDQPMVTIVIQGTASSSQKTVTTLNIQTTIGSRTPNFNNP